MLDTFDMLDLLDMLEEQDHRDVDSGSHDADEKAVQMRDEVALVKIFSEMLK